MMLENKEQIVKLLLAGMGHGGVINIGGGWRGYGEIYIFLPSGSTPTLIQDDDHERFLAKEAELKALIAFIEEQFRQGVIQRLIHDFQKEIEAKV